MKIKGEGSERTGKDRWLVSYADFITLLFAFFVVMYALSSISEEKYRTFSHSVGKAFPETFKNFSKISTEELVEFMTYLKNTKSDREITVNDEEREGSDFKDVDLILKIKEQFENLITKKRMRFKESANWVEIEVGSNVLFGTGSSILNDEAEKIIKTLGEVLRSTNNTITIEGFTDNIPIYNKVYPSNWELSADRAAAVASALIAAGVSQERLAVTGYGENFPIANNNTEEGRQLNRRIIIVVEKENNRKKYLATQEQ